MTASVGYSGSNGGTPTAVVLFPPVTEVGVSVRLIGLGGFTVKKPLACWPAKVAVIVRGVTLAAGLGVIEKVAVA